MKKIILTIAITALTLTIVAQTQAGPKSGGFNKSSSSKVQNVANSKITPVKTGGPQTKLNQGTSAKFKDYNLKFGTKFQYGTFYKGKHHDHWGQIRFDPRYGCDCYWDPCTLVWYYWCERDFCYYPVSYCPYRCYVCIEVVVETAIPSVPLTNAPNLVIPPSTPASPVNDIPPIPVPVAPRPE
jgi:hypothetical protein